MGHALDETLQDILIRWKRMSGYSTLWLPGTDHASIATEAKIVEAMRKEGVKKEDIGRETFLERAWAWKKQYGGRIVEQLKKLGSSCDWTRERFTMDEGCSKAVKEVFIKYYQEGLIYRGERIINWCPKCLTSISDAEVEYEDQAGHFWHLRYPLKDGSGYLELATTRPETLLGDTAVAVNPNDERYKDLVGKTLILPLVHREIPIVADDYVEMDFGTGVVKITPAHDPNDFEVGLRHNLEVINVMTDDAKIVDAYPKYAGMDRYEARKAIVEDLKAEGALVEIEDYNHNVGTCYRCGTTVEPRVSKQWFVKMKPLAQPAIDAVKSGKTKFVPERFNKIYFHWLENIKDWCISRQRTWGVPIPIIYCKDCKKPIVNDTTIHDIAALFRKEGADAWWTKDLSEFLSPEVQCECGCKEFTKEYDIMDVWFDSGVSHSAVMEQYDCLQWPADLYLEGADQYRGWFQSSLLTSVVYKGSAPYKAVCTHGWVVDGEGRKMSKSLGNGIDPLKVIDEYGADALRFMLATGNAPGNDMRYSDDKVKAARNFANKLWNASRFIMMNLPEDFQYNGLPEDLELEDRWIVSKFNAVAKEVGENLDKFEIGVASAKIYDFIWDVYCDWYIELTKPRIQAGGATMEKAQAVLVWVMRGMLKLLHPFMPYITEEIWQVLTGGESMIIVESYPVYDVKYDYADAAQFEKVIDAIRAIRNRRTEMQVPPSKKARVCIETTEPELYRSTAVFFEKLASASAVEVGEKFEMPDAATAVTDSVRIFIPMDELIDKDKELARLKKEQEKVQKDLDFLSKKLSNQGFLAKAPEKLVEAEKAKLAKAQEKMDKIMQSMAALQ